VAYLATGPRGPAHPHLLPSSSSACHARRGSAVAAPPPAATATGWLGQGDKAAPVLLPWPPSPPFLSSLPLAHGFAPLFLYPSSPPQTSGVPALPASPCPLDSPIGLAVHCYSLWSSPLALGSPESTQSSSSPTPATARFRRPRAPLRLLTRRGPSLAAR